MNNKIKNIVFNSLLGFLICIIIGLLFFGPNIFNHKLHAFQMVLFGLSGALFFSVYNFGNLKETIIVGTFLFVANFVFQGKAVTIVTILRDFVFFMSLYSSLTLYRFFLKKYYYSPIFIRALALSLFLGLFNILATILLVLIFGFSSSEAISGLFINGRYGALIGLGLGIGFDLFTKYRMYIVKFLLLMDDSN